MSTYKAKYETERKYYKYIFDTFTPPTLTANNNGSMGGDKFGVSASSEWGAYYAWHIFDGLNSSIGQQWASTTIPCTIDIYNPIPLNITDMLVENSGVATNYGIASGYISASDDETNWIQLTTFTNSDGSAGGRWNINLSSNTGYYKYYRIGVNTSTGTYLGIGELYLTATERTITEGSPSDYDFYEDVPVYKVITNNSNYYSFT